MGARLGRYELLGRIGTGGMAEVFLARILGVEGFTRELVVKRMRSELVTRPDAVKMFLDEARLLAKIQHPNIVQVFDLGEADGTYFIAMEFVEGPHLGRLARHVLREGQALPLLLSAYIVDRAADGLHFAHDAVDPVSGTPLALVHRDISPHNILISRHGDVKVADFGVAKAAGQAAETKSGVVKGKIAYMSPEQVYGEPLDRRSDVFALGIVLFELVTSRRLFKHKSELVAMQRITQEDAPSATLFNADIDAELARIISRALEREREQRYPSMEAMKHDLDQWISARAKGHLKSELAAFMKQYGPPLEVDRELGRMISSVAISAATDSLSQQEGVTEPAADALIDSLVRTGPDAQPVDDIHSARTHVGSVPFDERGQVSREGQKDNSSSHASLSTQAFVALKTNLSRPPTRFVGRKEILLSLERLFREEHALVTLVGPAGTGKTRLAQRYAELHLKVLSDAGGGAWFCDLTTARSAEDVVSLVAEVLRVPLTSGRTFDETVDVVGAALAARGDVLLVLDNFEQVVDAGPLVLLRWMSRAPGARFLVTSREVLRLDGEVCLEVAPLALPTDAKSALDAEAVQLFIDRARAVRPGYTATPQDAVAIAEIVRKLDGIPLAIELAAARMGVLPPPKILERLAKRFDLLKGGTRSSTPRQAALKSALDWSWELLTAVEQEALAQLSVFRGGMSLEAAEAVIDLKTHRDAPLALDVVQALKDKSLLYAVDQGEFSDEARFSMYESIRDYADYRLDELATQRTALGVHLVDETMGRHAAFFLDVAERFSREASGKGAGQKMARLLVDLPNLVAVHARATTRPRPGWATPEHGLRIAIALEALYAARGPFADQVRLLDAALAAAGEEADPILAIRALGARGRARRRLGDVAASRDDYVSALRIEKRVDARGEEGVTLRDLGVLASDEGRLDDAERNYKDALAIHRSLGDQREEATTLTFLAFLADERGRLDEARALYEEALALLRKVGERRLEGLLLGNYAGWEQERGDLSRAERHLESALRLLADCGDRTFEGPFRGYLGTLRHEQGRPDEAVRTIEAALASMRETGNLRYEALMEAFYAAALASLDRVVEARQALDRANARSTEVGDPRHKECITLCAAFLTLAEVRRLKAENPRADVSQLLFDAKKRVEAARRRGPATPEARDGTPSAAEQSDDVRRAMRLVERALAAAQNGEDEITERR
jgi:serine/threonine protein kinase/predicted ATPase